MPNLPISGFASGAPAQSGDQFVIARSGANYKLIGSDIKTLIVGAGSVSIASGKTFTVNNTLTLSGTDGSTLNVGTGGTLGALATVSAGSGVATAAASAIDASGGFVTSATFAASSGKKLTASNTITLAGTDGTTMTFPSTSATLARTDAGNTFSGNQSAPQFYNPTQTLTDGATITFNANLGAVATVTLGGTGRTLTPSNLVNGGTYVIIIKQDSGGSKTITTWTNFKWPGGVIPLLSASANAIDIVTGVSDGTFLYANIQQGFA